VAKPKKILLVVEKSRAYGRAICEGVAAFAQEEGGWELSLAGEKDDSAIARLRGYDGVIARILTQDTLKAVQSMKIPAVDVFGWKRWPGIALVDSDHAAVGRLAAECFLARRFRQFAFCGYTGVTFSEERGAAFARAVEEKGFVCDVFKTPQKTMRAFAEDVIRHEKVDLDANRDRFARWLAALPKPVGVFCCHDIRAYQLATICQRLGIRVPHEVALLGVDDDRLVCGFTSPMLSSIDSAAFEVGRGAARVLKEAMARRGKRSLRRIAPCVRVPPKRVVERASTEVYPVEPAWLSDVLVYIQTHYMENIGVEDLFRLAGRSHTTVTMTFKRVLGTTVRKELIRVRLDEAARLLKSTSRPVCRIAPEVGFLSPQYFNRSFRSAFGVTPQAFREQGGSLQKMQ
jgi:LacI family transcriptional regulator